MPQYLPVGVYLKQGRVSNTAVISDVPRGVCIIGPGSKNLTRTDVAIQRGYVTREAVTFAASGSTYTHLAAMDYTSDQVKKNGTLEFFDGTNYVVVPSRYWSYAGSQHISLSTQAWSSVKTYYFSYQANDSTMVTDLIYPLEPQPDLRAFSKVADRPGVSKYSENIDYRPFIEATAIVASASTLGTGTVSFVSSATYSGYETRTYTLTQTAPASATGIVSFSWSGSTQNSGSGTTAVLTGATATLEDGIQIKFTGTSSASFVNGDQWQFTIGNAGGITWGVSASTSETKTSSEVYLDSNSTITGTANTYYVISASTPSSSAGITVSFSGTTGAVSGTVREIGTSNYIALSTIGSGSASLSWTAAAYPYTTITYTTLGQAPSFGSTYYATFDMAKASADYNQVELVFSEEEAYETVGLPAEDNPLALAAQLAFAQKIPFLYLVQIEDTDGDDAYSSANYQDGLTATEGKFEITDVITLDASETVRGYMRRSIDFCASMDEKKYRLGWFWMPMNTELGDASTSGTLAYESQVSMDVLPESVSRGRYILMGQTWADRDAKLGDGRTVSLTLPAWSLAVANASLQATFLNPSDTLLHKEVVGFTDVESFTDAEMRLRAGYNLYLTEKLGSLFRVYDALTVHEGSDDEHEISAMVQKDTVTKIVTEIMTDKLIGLVPQSTGDAVQAIRSALAVTLNSLVSQQYIATYEDNVGNPRNLSAQNDIYVERVAGSRTAFNFKYFYFLRYPIKRLFGTYYVDTNIVFGSGGQPTVVNR